MQAGRKRGFTLGELLALVALIGVLSALLVPVLSQQTEAARTKSCLSNQQRIVAAIRMYMADHDQILPPNEHRPEVLAYFDTGPGGRPWAPGRSPHCNRARQANPYLRWVVILDAYVPNRAVWQCPSATIVSGATWIVPGPDWLGYLQAYEGAWGGGMGLGPCLIAYPAGWGGEVTDSIIQRRLAVPQMAPLYGTPAPGAFVQSIGTTFWPDLPLSEVPAPDRFVITGDGGVITDDFGLGLLAYPEICALDCGNSVCARSDWEACASKGADCGLYRMSPSDGSFLVNPALRAPYARHRASSSSAGPPWTRNGVNVGFLDGHAQWVASETLIAEVAAGEIDGAKAWGPTSDCGFADDHPGVPTIY